MDRPEWATVDPSSGEVYLTLTNNSKRSEEAAAATFTNQGDDIAQLGVGYETAPPTPLIHALITKQVTLSAGVKAACRMPFAGKCLCLVPPLMMKAIIPA